MRSLPIIVFAATVACTSAHADRVGAPLPVEETQERAPYDVDIVDEYGQSLDTFSKGRRFYVMGSQGDRYSIRVTNPTSRRVEAVISVDGLDVVDGETASLKKRGYIVPPHGTVVIDGFRVSTEAVAAFRFSAVKNSYAQRKGKGRNVGVIGVAIFEEAQGESATIVVPHHRGGHMGRRPKHDGRHYEEDVSMDDTGDFGGAEPAPAPAAGQSAKSSVSRYRPSETIKENRDRPGLGTEFGEQRTSSVQFTRFERANALRPTAYTELRYNDATGLRAMGIRIEPEVDEYEVGLRETAEAFPGVRFAQPPR